MKKLADGKVPRDNVGAQDAISILLPRGIPIANRQGICLRDIADGPATFSRDVTATKMCQAKGDIPSGF